jgi:hypothetical protein
LLLRLSIAVVMGFWTVDKMVNPEHAQAVFKNFYGLAALSSETLLVIGLVEAGLVAAFAAGLFKTFTYGTVLALHAISTFSSWRQYLDPFENLLFFAAWPMLAACIALFAMRHHDRLLSLTRSGRKFREPR